MNILSAKHLPCRRLSTHVLTIFLIVEFHIFAFSLSACYASPRRAQAPADTAGTQAEGPTVSAQSGATRSPARPIRLLLIQDLTGSILDERMPRVTPDDFRPVLQFAEENGGDIGFVAVSDHPHPLIRVRFIPPESSQSSKPTSRNLYLAIKEQSENARQDAEHQHELQKYLQESRAQAEAFIAQISPLLKAAPASSTDLISALNISAIFFNEIHPFHDPYQILVAATDGIETKHRPSSYHFSIPASTQILIANTTADIGILNPQSNRIKLAASPQSALQAALYLAKGL